MRSAGGVPGGYQGRACPTCSSSPGSWAETRYFVLGRVGRDQVEDYAQRKGWSVAEEEKWLSPSLGYRTEDE